jgi:hypothetical protein
MSIIRRTLLAFYLVFACALSAMGEEPVKKDIKDAPKAVSGRTTAVAVEHEGADTIGAKLAFELKELFNSASLFNLTDKDMPKITVFISTVPEFASRPEVGSAFAVVWAYSESEGTLKHYLGREVGVVSDASARTAAQQLAERTDEIALKYAYLFGR